MIRKPVRYLLMLIIIFIEVLILVVLFKSISLMDKSEDDDELIALELADYIFMPGVNWIVSPNEMPQKMLDALSGDPEAARIVATRYASSSGQVRVERIVWFTIGAENGALEVQYALADRLLNYSVKDFDTIIRGIFWLNKAVEKGYRYRNTRIRPMLSFEDYGYTVDTAQPPDDMRFPDNYALLSETEIADCKTGALQGNKKAALLLGKYYEEMTVDNELSEYWYRIGAQNGSPECQYKMGRILSGKNDEFDQVRGRFWLDQAAKNGYNSK